jgi:hypothetical protein
MHIVACHFTESFNNNLIQIAVFTLALFPNMFGQPCRGIHL